MDDLVPVDLADDPPRYYRIPLPSGGDVCVRIAGEGDPVLISAPGQERPVVTVVSREVAWALWAVLSDGLLPWTDACPDWTREVIEPTDEHGRPLPSLFL
ncbi:hypothetical protein AB0N61_17645 [Microbacterium sp. NPDC089320]|uniref:hypothetical protein n=1 Tax=Microbacterium sp. NPDC089320 TaxID=3155182 RepID=UPI0034318FAC